MNIPRRYIIIIIVVVIILLVAGILWVVFSDNDLSDQEGAAGQADQLTQIGATSQTFRDVINSDSSGVENLNLKSEIVLKATDDIVVEKSSHDLYFAYSAEDDSFFTINPDGSKNVRFVAGKDVAYSDLSPDGKKLLYKDVDNENFYVDLLAGSVVKLPNEIQGFAWSPDSNKIVYQYVNTFNQQNELFVANPDATGFESIYTFEFFPFENQNVLIEWPQESKVVFLTQPTGIDGSEAIEIDLRSKVVRSLSEDLFYTILFSPDGRQLLFDVIEVTNEAGEDKLVYSLYVRDVLNGDTRKTSLQAFAQECTFIDDDRIVCAVTSDMILQDTPEVLVEYRFSTNEIRGLTALDSENEIDYQGLQYVTEDKKLYYMNNKTNTLESIDFE